MPAPLSKPNTSMATPVSREISLAACSSATSPRPPATPNSIAEMRPMSSGGQRRSPEQPVGIVRIGKDAVVDAGAQRPEREAVPEPEKERKPRQLQQHLVPDAHVTDPLAEEANAKAAAGRQGVTLRHEGILQPCPRSPATGKRLVRHRPMQGGVIRARRWPATLATAFACPGERLSRAAMAMIRRGDRLWMPRPDRVRFRGFGRSFLYRATRV